MKFIKPFKGATGGNPYPIDFKVGDECPDDLIAAANQVGAVEVEQPKPKTKAEKD